MNSWSRTDWLIIFIFAALVALFYWRILTPNLADRQSFPPGDFHAQFWAFATFEVRELSAGRLPLWNPYTFAGAPFWADVQAAVFYPPSLLTLLLSIPWGFSLFALEIEAIAHFWLAAVFMYLFSRDLTHNRPAAFISALTFSFSGYLTGYPSQQLAVLEADIWLPLILFFLHRAYHQTGALPTASSPRLLYLLLAGLAWGLTLLAGHPQSALIVAYISIAYFTFLSILHPTPHTSHLTPHTPCITHYVLRFTFYVLHLIPPLFIFLLTGLGLAAIQFIPAVEYTLLSVRAEGTYDAMSGGFPISDIIQLLLPGQVSFYSPLYIGVAGLVLALSAIFAAPHRYTIFWGIVAGVTLLITFGGNTFLYPLLYLFTPGFSIFRGQERWAFATIFSSSVLVGYGFQGLMCQVSSVKCQVSGVKGQGLRVKYQASTNPVHVTHYGLRITHYVLHFTQPLLLLALLFTFFCFYGLNDTGWTPASPFYNLLGAATLLTLLLALTWLLWKFAIYLHPMLFTTLTAGLICLDLFTANWQTNLYPQLPEWHVQMPGAVKAIKQDAIQFPAEPYRVYNEFRLYDNYGVPYELEDLWGASPLRPDRYDKFLAPPMPIERAWELLNVKYVITWRETLYLPSTIIHQEPAGDGVTYIHRLEKAGPRAWFVSQAEIAGDATILQKIADPNFDRWHIALLEPEAKPYLNLLDQATPDPAENITFYVLRFTAHASSLTYQVDTPIPTLLILSEPYYPGWQATLDGQPVPILRANYILRAIPIPAGEHTLELAFQPPSLTIGATISALTIIALIITLLKLHKREAQG